MEKKEKHFWLAIRQALLMAVDAIERLLEMHPRTSQLRDELKRSVIQQREI